MLLTREQDRVLETIFRLGSGNRAAPVTLGVIHGTFADMDVRDLVEHLGILLDYRLIQNARKTTEKIGNVYIISPEGIDYYNRNFGKHP